MTARGGPGRAGGLPGQSARPRFTSRAAVLAVVICAIALSLAYPVREYIAERRQIDQLVAQNAQLATADRKLKAERAALDSPSYVEQQARDRLHMCFPTQRCYVVIVPARPSASADSSHTVTPWYARLWHSVQLADKAPGHPA